MDHFKLLEMLESQIILLVSTHGVKGVYSYVNAQMKFPIAWDSPTCIPKGKGTTGMCTEDAVTSSARQTLTTENPPSLSRLNWFQNVIWFETDLLVRNSGWYSFSFLVDNKTFCKRLLCKHLEMHRNPKRMASRGPHERGGWEPWGRLQTRSLRGNPDPSETLTCRSSYYWSGIFTYGFRNLLWLL